MRNFHAQKGAVEVDHAAVVGGAEDDMGECFGAFHFHVSVLAVAVAVVEVGGHLVGFICGVKIGY